jgi:hypothetical protein
MWLFDILIVLVLIAGVWGFVTMTRSRTRSLSSHTSRSAEDMYDEFADPPAVQKRFARKRSGSWRDKS